MPDSEPTRSSGRPDQDASAIAVVDAWLDQFADRLRGPRRARRAVVAELRDGLLEAVDAHDGTGISPSDAAGAALREFGQPAEIADAFAPELAGRQARHVAVALMCTGPLLGLLWGAAATTSHLLPPPTHAAPPWQWPELPAALRLVFALLAMALAAGLPAGLLAVAATGRPSRWLPSRPRLAPTAACTLAVAALGIDLVLLATLTVAAIAAPGHLVWAPVVAAGLASLTRLVINARATRRLLLTRAALA